MLSDLRALVFAIIGLIVGYRLGAGSGVLPGLACGAGGLVAGAFVSILIDEIELFVILYFDRRHKRKKRERALRPPEASHAD